MKRIERDKNTPSYVPDYVALSITDIHFDYLKSQGIKYVAFDVDNTLVPYFGIELSDATKKHLMIEMSKFKAWCIASNRITPNLSPMALSFGAGIVPAKLFRRKPSRRYYRRVLKHLHAKPEEVVMIGDKLIADVWGARRMGMHTVWVERIGKDMVIERLFRTRWIEFFLMRKYLKKAKLVE